MKQNRILLILLIAIISSILLFPSIQGQFKLFEEPLLGGYIPEIKKPVYNNKSFIAGKFQNQLESYAKREYGFQAWAIRLYNQYQFSIFHRANVPRIVIGKENYIFGKNYIETIYGKDFIGKDSIDEKLRKYKIVRDTLLKQGKNILTVIAASKGTFFEEFIPDEMKHDKGLSNYTYYLQRFKEENIEFIDFDSYFRKIKSYSKHPLYAKLGVHWTQYGGYLASDSLINYFEHNLKIDLPDVELRKLEIKEAEGTDIDIWEGLNLIFKIDDVRYAYPTVEYNKENKDTLRVLFIGDSFFYSLNSTNFLSGAFSDSEFWYYNNGGYERKAYTEKEELLFLKHKISKFDFIVLVANQATLHSFTWNFIDDLYNTITIT